MDSDISKNISLLANKIVNIVIEKTNGDLRSPLPFLYAYEKAHSINSIFEDIKFDKSDDYYIRQPRLWHYNLYD